MIRYSILKEYGLVITVITDLMPTNEIVKFREAMISHPDFSLDYDLIADMSRLEKSFSITDIKYLATMDTSKKVRGRIAIVAASDVDFGSYRMWEMLSYNKRISEADVFREMDSAIEWLGKTQYKEQIFSELTKLYDI